MNKSIKESEIIILGTILNNNNYILKSMDLLKEEDFYFTNHRFIYHSMIELYKKNIQFDSIILFNQLKKEDKGNVVTLYEISDISTYTAFETFESHIKLIKNNSLSRKLNTICKRAIQNNEEDPRFKIERLENDLLGLKTTSAKDKIYKLSDVMSMTMEKIEKAYNSKNGFTGIETGLRKFDNAINGLQRKEFIVLGARPSMGKTALSLTLLENIKANVLYIQLDMSSEGMGQRMLASECYIPNGKVGRGKLTNDEWDKLGKGFNKLSSKKNIFIYEPKTITVNKIRWKSKEVKLKYGLDVIIIDHIGKIQSVSKGSRYEQMSKISHELKSIARELDVSLIGLCQLSRAVEGRADKRPMLSDLRDTGSIEEDADVIGLLYRNGYYNRQEGDQLLTDTLEIEIAKNRNGKVGTLKFNYDLQIQRISEF